MEGEPVRPVRWQEKWEDDEPPTTHDLASDEEPTLDERLEDGFFLINLNSGDE